MTGKIKRLIYLLAGLTAGAAAFAAVELLNAAPLPDYLTLALLQGASIGFIFGFCFGFTDGILYRELKTGILRALTAAAAGAVTAAAAQVLASQGMMLSARPGGLDYEQTMHLLLPIWRGIGWMLMGTAIGAIDGIHKKSLRRCIAGIIGGLAGGLIGGLSFEFLVRMLPASPYIMGAGLLLMGGLTGLSLGEFERRFSYARLRILNGNLKDREYLLIKKKTAIGSGRSADICITGYENLPDSLFRLENGEVYLKTAAEVSAEGLAARAAAVQATMLNDQPLPDEKPLKYQDVIQLGSLKLLYLPL